MALISLEKNAGNEKKIDFDVLNYIRNKGKTLYSQGTETLNDLLAEAGLYWDALKKGLSEVQRNIGTQAGQAAGEWLSSNGVFLDELWKALKNRGEKLYSGTKSTLSKLYAGLGETPNARMLTAGGIGMGVLVTALLLSKLERNKEKNK